MPYLFIFACGILKITEKVMVLTWLYHENVARPIMLKKLHYLETLVNLSRAVRLRCWAGASHQKKLLTC